MRTELSTNRLLNKTNEMPETNRRMFRSILLLSIHVHVSIVGMQNERASYLGFRATLQVAFICLGLDRPGIEFLLSVIANCVVLGCHSKVVNCL